MAEPVLTYGGYPLATDVDQQVASFMDRYQATEDLRDVAPTLASNGSRADQLAIPNYPDKPKLRPNQLYWPTGASRWAIGYFFADDVQKDKIVTAAYPEGASNTALELRVVENEEFTADLFLLTPRKVSCVDDGNNLWLLPLVDERYFWQFRDIGDFAVTTASTWAGMFTQFDSRLGVSISADTADSKYLIPDPEELTRRYDNAGVMLDAVCHSVGQRLVRWPDGTLHSMNWTTSAAQLTTNIESKTPWKEIAGGEFDFGPVPANVNVVCRRFVFHVKIPEKVKTYTEGAGSHLDSPETTTGTVKTVHTTAYADQTTDGSTVDNNVALDNLAEEIASDFYDSTLHQYDRTFSGIKLWDSCGYDDHILYQFGGEYPVLIDGEYEKWAHTRVQSSPVNFGTEIQLSQDSTLTPLTSHQFGVMDEELDGANPATFSVHVSSDAADTTQTSTQDSTINIEVFKFADQVIAVSTKCHAFFDFESEKWYVHPRNGVFSGTVQNKAYGPNAADWSMIVGDGAIAGTAGYDICYIKHNTAGSPVGSEFLCRLPHVGDNGAGRLGPAPNLEAGNIIKYSYDDDGNPFCVSAYLDAAIGVIMFWDDTPGTIPFGWQRNTNMDGRLAVGVDSGQSSEPDIDSPSTTEQGGSGSTAGTWQHDHADDMSHAADAHTIDAHAPTDHTVDAHVPTDHNVDTHEPSDHTITDHSAEVHTTVGSSATDFDADDPAISSYADHPAQSHTGGAAPGLGHDDQTHSGDTTGALVGLGHDDQGHTGSLSHDDQGHSGTLTHSSDAHTIAAINHYPPMWTGFFIKRFWE